MKILSTLGGPVPWSLAFLTLLAGCASPPDTARAPLPARVAPADYVGTPAETGDADGWLAQFGDPALEGFVDRVLSDNLDLRVAATRLQTARLDTVLVVGEQLPTLDGSFNASRGRAVRSGGGAVTENDFTLSLNLGWELDLWGRLRNSTSASLAEYEAAWADYRGARLSLAANATRAWFDAITSREQVELAASTLRSYEDGARLIRSRYETGTSSALDLRLTLANVASAAAVLQQRSEQFAGALRALEVLAGTYPAGTLPLDADLPRLNAPIPSGLPSELLARRPDLVAAERRLAAAQQRSLRARKDMLPAIRLSSGIGTTSEELENIFDGDALWNLAAGLTQPLFQGGQLRARAGQAAVAADAAALDYARTALAAFRDVEQALAAEDFLRAREAFLLEAVEQSAAAEELSWNEYTAGLGDIVSVLEAQRRAIAARTEYLDVRNARLQNRVNLHVALGGDFRDDDLPDPETPPPVRFIEHMGP